MILFPTWAIFANNFNIHSMYALYQDIKLSNNKFYPANEFSRLVLNNLVDYSIFTTDNDLIINGWYAGAARLFGYQPEEVIGQHIDTIFTDEDRKNGISLEEKETALKEGRATDNRWHVLKDGNLFYAYGLIFPLREPNGEIIGFIKILRDLTHRKMNEEAIQQHMKDLEELIIHKDNILHILSHDLRSPLGTIIGIADYLKSDIGELQPEEVKYMLNTLYQASTDELDMLDYLVEWARVKHASDVFNPVMLNLQQKVMKVFETFNELAAVNSIRLHNEVKKGTLVFADKKMLLSILQNLVSNAIKYNRIGGIITISAYNEDDKVVVKVKDTGIGMSLEQLNQLFKAQLKTLAKTRKENKGAGIGLLLVKGFVERNGGEICAESIKDQGTSFYFTLPARDISEKQVNAENLQFNVEA